MSLFEAIESNFFIECLNLAASVNIFFCSFSECADTEQLEQQVLRTRFLVRFQFYQQSDAGIKPRTAG